MKLNVFLIFSTVYFSPRSLFGHRRVGCKFVTSYNILQRDHHSQKGQVTFKQLACSETTPTGESRFHIITPLGIGPTSRMTGSKLVDHWTSRTVCECSENAGSPQGDWTQVPHDRKQMGRPNAVRLQALHRTPPQQPTMLVVKQEGGPAVSVKVGQKNCVRSSGIITLLARWPSDSFGTKHTAEEDTMINHVGVTNVARQR